MLRKVSVLLFALSCGASIRAQPIADGKALFVANGCYQCHGYVGQGGAAPRIAPTVYPFEAFDRLVRRPANEMPAYAPEVLDERVLRAIYDYLRSIPEPPPLSELKLLR